MTCKWDSTPLIELPWRVDDIVIRPAVPDRVLRGLVVCVKCDFVNGHGPPPAEEYIASRR